MGYNPDLTQAGNREEMVKLFLSILQAAPDSLVKNTTGDSIASHVIKGAEKLLDYIESGKVS